MVLKISKSRDIPPFLAMQIMKQANQMQEAGSDLVHLEVGQPSTPPPAAVCRALESSLGHISSHGYSVAMGNPALRQRIAAHYLDWYQVAADWQKIAITPGSSLGFVIAFLSAFNEGDRVAIVSPGYPAYFNSLMALGIIPQLLPARASESWKPDLELLVANGNIPDGLLLASPANPTGVVMRDAELEAICR